MLRTPADALRTTAANRMKALVATASFPATGGSRIDKFVKFLPQAGIEPIVLSALENYSDRAHQLRTKLYPPELKTLHGRSRGWSYFTERYLDRNRDAADYNLLRVLSWPERFVYLPDYMVRWIEHGVRLGREAIEREGATAVLTSSPPESTHLIGLRLKRELGIRWVADFRDLWTERTLLHRPATPLHDRWIRRLERSVFAEADHIIANTPENAQRYLERFPSLRDRVSVIPNGFDADDFIGLTKQDPDDAVFRIGHAGNLDKHGYPWRTLLDALQLLAKDIGDDKVRLEHCGFYSRRVEAYLEERGMRHLVNDKGMLSHHQAMQLAAQASVRVVLLLESEYSTAIVPMKLYNYLAMQGPILGIVPEGGEAAKIIERTGTGTAVSSKRGAAAAYEALKAFYLAWKAGRTLIAPDAAAIAHYDRRSQAMRLARVLETPVVHPGLV